MIKAPAWLQLLSRSASALLGGYALSYAASACLARILPLSAADAVIDFLRSGAGNRATAR